LGCDVSLVTESADIKEALGADSLAVVELIMAIEDAFGITIEEDAAQSAVTVGDVVKLVAGLTQ
jgi:acyl carrier protein